MSFTIQKKSTFSIYFSSIHALLFYYLKKYVLMKLFPLFLLAFSMTFVACSDDDSVEANSIAIEIQSPTEGKEVSLSAGDHLHNIIIIESTGAMHQIEYMIYPTGDRDNPIIILTDHGNGNESEVRQFPEAPNSIKFADYPALVLGSYVMEIKACGEHMCQGETIVTETRNFTIVD
jgi:hypothetical protein